MESDFYAFASICPVASAVATSMQAIEILNFARSSLGVANI